jgi:hypothetical protein
MMMSGFVQTCAWPCESRPRRWSISKVLLIVTLAAGVLSSLGVAAVHAPSQITTLIQVREADGRFFSLPQAIGSLPGTNVIGSRAGAAVFGSPAELEAFMTDLGPGPLRAQLLARWPTIISRVNRGERVIVAWWNRGGWDPIEVSGVRSIGVHLRITIRTVLQECQPWRPPGSSVACAGTVSNPTPVVVASVSAGLIGRVSKVSIQLAPPRREGKDRE